MTMKITPPTPKLDIAALTERLETVTCSRCGGSGKHSWCERYRDVCFKCGGSGKVYTKRGAAAAKFLEASRCVEAGTIQVGDTIRFEYFAGDANHRFFAKVEEIKPAAYKVMNATTGEFEVPAGVLEFITTRGGRYGSETIGAHYHVSTMVRKGWPDAVKRQQYAAAVAYQATLTKAGTPRKTRTKGATA